ncbi:MAG: hypothetical protein M1820_003780 [Bogoriella megaspora]|nr:MAG: hypothetical protein M1820_003780 [Bogoriella megaspora]
MPDTGGQRPDQTQSLYLRPDIAFQDGSRKERKNNAATGASAAGMRAVTAQMVAFYFRAPAKAFFRTRIDYMAYARAINPRVQRNEGWSWRITTPGLLAHAIKEHGWSFIPKQVAPPLMANLSVGAMLYTTYLQSLGAIYEPASHSSKRVFPPPPLSATFTAGFLAGTVQSLVAAPLDALQVRFSTQEMLEGHYKSMWQYASDKLRDIGLRGIFAGWTLSFAKDSLGYGVFFSTFEYVKAQSYHAFLTRYYHSDRDPRSGILRSSQVIDDGTDRPTIRPHYAVEPAFILLAGLAASLAQQVVQHPLTELQNVHFERLESLDYQAKLQHTRVDIFRLYFSAYEKTFRQCKLQARQYGGWARWLYKEFWMSTLRQIPSTSAGLIVFEVVRRKYGMEVDAARIEKDGYDILLT